MTDESFTAPGSPGRQARPARPAKKVGLRITHPDGVPMRFTEHLSLYLVNECKQLPSFRVGNWLARLDDAEFELLRKLAEQWHGGDESRGMDDFVGVVLTAVAAERGGRVESSYEELQQLVEHLAHVVAIESFRRNGWIELAEPLTTDPEGSLHVRVTDKGFAASERMGTR